jgi:hypothetical protein
MKVCNKIVCKSVVSYEAVNKINNPVTYKLLPLDVCNPFLKIRRSAQKR